MISNTSAAQIQNLGRVVVLMGGLSSEREISLISGQRALEALLKKGVDAVGLDVQADLINKLIDLRPDRAFIALHGRGGEDGTIQSLLTYLKIPYTGSGILGSAIMMDKIRCKWLLKAIGLSTPEFMPLTENFNTEIVIKEFGLPLVIKPISEGSSLGVSIVTQPEQVKEAWELASQYQSGVMAEKYIKGDEVTVGILNNKALPIVKITTPRAFNDYQAKYFLDTTQHICPSGLGNDLERSIQGQAFMAFKACGGENWGRVDGIVTLEGKFEILEINSLPGLTTHSLVPFAAEASGISFENLILEILLGSNNLGSRY